MSTLQCRVAHIEYLENGANIKFVCHYGSKMCEKDVSISGAFADERDLLTQAYALISDEVKAWTSDVTHGLYLVYSTFTPQPDGSLVFD